MAELPPTPELAALRPGFSQHPEASAGWTLLQGGAERSQQLQAGFAILFPPQSLDRTHAWVVPAILSCRRKESSTAWRWRLQFPVLKYEGDRGPGACNLQR